MVDLRCRRHLSIAQAYLAQTGITLEYALADLVPARPVPTLMSAASTFVGKGAGLPVGLVVLAVA